MSELTKEWLLKTIAELEEERDAVPGAVNEDAGKALAAMKLALASLEAEPVPFDALRDAVAEVSGGPAMEWSDIYKGHQEVPFINFNSLARIVDRFRTAPPVPVSVPAAMEMDDDFDSAFEHGKAVGWNACRAAMLQGAEQTNYRAIVERIAEIIHGKVTDIDLLTVTVKSMKDKLQK